MNQIGPKGLRPTDHLGMYGSLDKIRNNKWQLFTTQSSRSSLSPCLLKISCDKNYEILGFQKIMVIMIRNKCDSILVVKQSSASYNNAQPITIFICRYRASLQDIYPIAHVSRAGNMTAVPLVSLGTSLLVLCSCLTLLEVCLQSVCRCRRRPAKLHFKLPKRASISSNTSLFLFLSFIVVLRYMGNVYEVKMLHELSQVFLQYCFLGL